MKIIPIYNNDLLKSTTSVYSKVKYGPDNTFNKEGKTAFKKYHDYYNFYYESTNPGPNHYNYQKSFYKDNQISMGKKLEYSSFKNRNSSLSRSRSLY